MPAASPFISRTTTVRFRRGDVTLGLAADLFSSAGVDAGTLRLLRSLERPESPLAGGRPLRVLDVGCGVGTLGLAIATAGAEHGVRVTAIDRDALAVHVTRRNATANRLLAGDDPAVTVPDAGVGYAPVRAGTREPFDLIVMNIPAKAGRGGLAELLFGAGRLLRPGGTLAFVHVTPLSAVIADLEREFETAHGAITTTHGRRGKEHVVLHWRFEHGLPERPRAAALDPFRRADVPATLEIAGLGTLPWTAVHDVAEFDTPHFWTPLLVDALAAESPPALTAAGERALVLNPGHGMLPLLLARRRGLREIGFVGRDTLELAVAAENFANGAGGDRVRRITPPRHPVFPWLPAPGTAARSIAGALTWHEGPAAHAATLAALRDALAPDGVLALACSTGQLPTLDRLADEAGLATGAVRRRHGFAATCLRRR